MHVGDKRQSDIIDARQEFMDFCRNRLSIPRDAIPEFLGRLEKLIDAKITDAVDQRY